MNALLLTEDPDTVDILWRPMRRAGIRLKARAPDAGLLAGLAADPPDLVVLDCMSGVLADIEACAAIVRQAPAPTVIIHAAESFVHAVHKRTGAAPYWLSTGPGWVALSQLVRQVRKDLLDASQVAGQGRLTKSETSLLELLLQHYSYAAIAVRMGVTKGTIAKTVHRLKAKLGARDIDQLRDLAQRLLAK